MKNADFPEYREQNGGIFKRFTYKNAEVLRCDITYPVFAPKTFQTARINRWYAGQAALYESSAKNKFYPEAVRQYNSLLTARGFEPLGVGVSYGVMYSQNGLLSVFLDTSEQLRYSGSHLYRTSQTWLTKSAARMPIGYFFKPTSPWRNVILDEINQRLESEEISLTGAFYADAQKRLKRYISGENYYLADDGFVLYFQQGVIAPANAGIPSFLIPYGALAPYLNMVL